MIPSSTHLGEEELLKTIEEAARFIEVGARYIHYRNNIYRVKGLSILDATQEPAVLYQKESGPLGLQSIIWVRTVRSWLEEVSVDNRMIPRFRKE